MSRRHLDIALDRATEAMTEALDEIASGRADLEAAVDQLVALTRPKDTPHEQPE